jgi:hypothetical protein
VTVDDEQTPARRRLKVDLRDLAETLEMNLPETSHYLDLDTGEIIMVQDESSRAVETIYEEIDSDDPAAFAAELGRRDMPQWEKDALLDADRVEAGLGITIVRIPCVESRDAYEDMETFIETVRSARLQDRLSNAIRGRGAFRRFKDALEEHPGEREGWFAFKDARMRQRALDWLREEGIEPIVDDDDDD